MSNNSVYTKPVNNVYHVKFTECIDVKNLFVEIKLKKIAESNISTIVILRCKKSNS